MKYTADCCTIYRVAGFCGKRWTLLILLELSKRGPNARFSSLKKKIPGITPKMLSARLKELEFEGLVKKTTKVLDSQLVSKYSLTESGEEFFKVLNSIKEWGLKWKKQSKSCELGSCRNCQF